MIGKTEPDSPSGLPAAANRPAPGILLILIPLSLCIAGCSTPGLYTPPEFIPDDTLSIPEPEEEYINYYSDAVNEIIVRPVKRSLELSRQLRRLFNRPKQAFNVDAFDEVPDSSWFTNRNTVRPLTPAQVALGPDRGPGPETEGPWTITGAKEIGGTPGFEITDGRGDRYILKFDPLDYPELASGAEIITTKILYAAGYNVPENHIVYFHPRILNLGEVCVLTDVKGNECPMLTADLTRILQKIEGLPDGRIRALSSKFLEGKPLGGFRYQGFREDDPNDIFPHEHRRELRGLAVLSAWLKQLDTKDGNNLDMYVEEDGRRFIRHYLLDFGYSLGSATRWPQPRQKGYEYEFDPGVMLMNAVCLGLYVRPWEKLGEIRYPSIGRYNAFDYDPGRTKMTQPNPAFANLTDLDGYWAAKLVMSFTDSQLEAVVKEARYSDPAAAAYLLEMLKQRRDMTGRHWYSRVNCLDEFVLKDKDDGEQVLQFTDKGIASGLWPEESTSIRMECRIDGRPALPARTIGSRTELSIPRLLREVESSGIRDKSGSQWELIFKIRRNESESWGPRLNVYLQRGASSGRFRLIGLRREN